MGHSPRQLPEGWAWTRVDQITVHVEYGSSAKTDEDPAGVPVLRMGNIVDGQLVLNELKYLPATHEEFPKLLLRKGDLLFNRTNSPELVGKTAVFHGAPERCSFASYLIRAHLADGVEPDFIAAYINSGHGRNWIRSVVTQQVGQANVNGTKLRQLAVPLPPPAEQRRIVAELQRSVSLIEGVRSMSDDNCARAVNLRQGTLAKLFSQHS
jgi:type I restriction enzyme S subunit